MKKFKNFLFVFLFFLNPIFSSDIFIQDDAGNLIAKDGTQDDLLQNSMGQNMEYKPAFMKTFLSLIAVVVLIILCFWIFRRLMSARVQTANNEKIIKIIEKRVISTKSMLYLIEVDGQKVLISESQGDVKTIHSFKE